MGTLLPPEERGKHSQRYRTRSGYAEWLPLAQMPMGILGGISSRRPQVQTSKWPDYLALPLPCQRMGQLPWSKHPLQICLVWKRAVHRILSSHCPRWALEAESKPVSVDGFDSLASMGEGRSRQRWGSSRPLDAMEQCSLNFMKCLSLWMRALISLS